MNLAFADTYFFLALLDTREPRHQDALLAARDPSLRIVTSEWVLVEFGNAYSHPADRPDFVATYQSLLNHPRVTIVPADSQLLQRGVDLFEQRPDKEWSLVDCLSFVIMGDLSITDALTGDRHFEQAGFKALLK
jgi:predicted nucleic acid-binding protein